jgi:hypothetical protein
MSIYKIAWFPGALSIVLILPLYQIIFAFFKLIYYPKREQCVNLYIVEFIPIVFSLDCLLMIHQIPVCGNIEFFIEALQF